MCWSSETGMTVSDFAAMLTPSDRIHITPDAELIVDNASLLSKLG